MDLLWTIPFNFLVDMFAGLGFRSLSEPLAYGTMFGICWEVMTGFPNIKRGMKEANNG